jgi:hypothetical protein
MRKKKAKAKKKGCPGWLYAQNTLATQRYFEEGKKQLLGIVFKS